MGMFDSFMGYWKCPDCGRSDEIEVQTKQLDNFMNRYHTGMRVTNMDHPELEGDYTIIESVWCPHCSYVMHEGDGLVYNKLKDEWVEHVVHIIIEDNIYKEMVFTGEKKKVGPFNLDDVWPDDGGNGN